MPDDARMLRLDEPSSQGPLPDVTCVSSSAALPKDTYRCRKRHYNAFPIRLKTSGGGVRNRRKRAVEEMLGGDASEQIFSRLLLQRMPFG